MRFELTTSTLARLRSTLSYARAWGIRESPEANGIIRIGAGISTAKLYLFRSLFFSSVFEPLRQAQTLAPSTTRNYHPPAD